MKLLAGVNVSALIVARLRSSGWDVTRVVDLMDARTPDTEIVAAARERGAVLISHEIVKAISALAWTPHAQASTAGT